MKRFFWESDGGGHWEGESRRIVQPRTYYVIDRQTDERIDVPTKADAVRLCERLNAEDRAETA